MPAMLESASERVKHSARAAVERTIEGIGLAALATANVFQRDILLEAQFELNRKSAMFALTFNDSLDEMVRRESVPRAGDSGGFTQWDAMTLVEDREVERKVSAERFGLEIAHNCEWELRELDAYMGSLLGTPQERNPLRPEVVGLALIKGIEATSERSEVRALLLSELGRVLAAEMRATYTAHRGRPAKGWRSARRPERQGDAAAQPSCLRLRQPARHADQRRGCDGIGPRSRPPRCAEHPRRPARPRHDLACATRPQRHGRGRRAT